MRWAHYGHCKEIYVKVGQKVKKGQKIASLGGTGTDQGHPDVNKSPHLHFEIWKQDPRIRGYNSYSTGLSKEKLLQIYEDPTPYITKTIPTLYDHLGYGFLSRVNSTTLHPGLDINGPGQDLGNPEYAVFDGMIEWVGKHVNGWGNHFYIKREEPIIDEDYMALKDTLTETSLAKAKAGYFVWELSDSDGKDLQDYLKVNYNGKPLGEQNYKALIDYLEKHSRRQKVLKFLKDKGLLDDIKNL